MIAAVVVTHSAPAEVLDACLRSLQSAGGVDRVLVVDNGRARALPAATTAADVELMQVPNRGYGAAANVGIRRATELGATQIVLLNDDITVRDGWLEPLVAALSGPDVGAAQPKLLVAGSLPPRIDSLGVAIGDDGAGTDIGDGALDVVGAAESDIARFTGGAVMLKPEFVAATGGFDERWFLYYEDVDLGARGASLGWRYRLAPASTVEHARSTSTAGDAARTRYLQERNRLWHAFRHCDPATIGRAVWLSVRRLRHAPRGVHARALLAGLAGAPGAWWRRARHLDRIG